MTNLEILEEEGVDWIPVRDPFGDFGNFNRRLLREFGFLHISMVG